VHRYLLFMLFIACSIVLSATVNIGDGDEVYGIWSAEESPYIIAREAIVPEGETLTLEPGVEVRLQSANQDADKARLVVQGVIHAVGTQQQPIVFSADGYGNWGAVMLQDTDSENNQFIHCRFNSADRFYDGDENVYGALALYASHAAIIDCQFTGNARYGLAVREYSDPYIANCVFNDNEWSGVYVREGAEAQFVDCEMTGNGDYGIYVREGGTAVLTDCTATDNMMDGVYAFELSQIIVSGGSYSYNHYSGVNIQTSTLALTDCEVFSNTGSGVYLSDESAGVVTGCVISQNGQYPTAVGRNGITASTSDLQVLHCQISDNWLNGIDMNDNYGAVVQGCDISDNNAYGLYMSFTADTDVSGNIIHNNRYSGIYSGENGTPVIHNNDIYANRYSGVETYRSTTALVNNLIHENVNAGIEFYCWDDGSSTGNVLWCNGICEIYIRYHCFISITNTSFYAPDHECVLVGNIASATMCNCIFTNENSIGKSTDSEATVSYSLFLTDIPEGITDGGGNLTNTDPLYASPDTGDLRLQEGSPCFDAGNPDMTFFTLPATDPDGNPRIWPQRIDMGAYERYTNLAPTLTAWEPANNDLYLETGTTVQFTVHASDWEPVSYLWQLDGEPLADADSVCVVTFDEGFHILLVTVTDSELQTQTRWTVHAGAVSAEDDPAASPLALTVGTNPARLPVALRYSLPNRTSVRIAVYDIRGRLVRGWSQSGCESGTHELLWDGRDATGRTVANGVYLARLQVVGAMRQTKLLLLK